MSLSLSIISILKLSFHPRELRMTDILDITYEFPNLIFKNLARKHHGKHRHDVIPQSHPLSLNNNHNT